MAIVIVMIDDYGTQFGKRLRRVLMQQGLTKRQAAAAMECSGVTTGQWTRGNIPYCVQALSKLRKHTGVDLNELICGSAIEPNTKYSKKSKV